jgi:L-ascorbate metabolism protein UlaG (beta-lactamase superfamily)
VGGARRGPNTVFIIEADGLRLCHLGDLGHMPGNELLERIGRPDVMFIPVGGFFTIDASEAAEIAGIIRARLTIPMHYRTGVKDTPVGTVDAFALVMGAERAAGSSMEVDAGRCGPGAVVLDYLR